MLKPPEHLRSIVDHDGAVILDIPHNLITTLNPTASYVWERLKQGIQIDAIAAELARETGTALLVVETDVNEFMEQLKSKHLLLAS